MSPVMVCFCCLFVVHSWQCPQSYQSRTSMHIFARRTLFLIKLCFDWVLWFSCIGLTTCYRARLLTMISNQNTISSKWGKQKQWMAAFKPFPVILKDNAVSHCVPTVFLSKGSSLNPLQPSIEVDHRPFFFLWRPSPIWPPSVLT